MHITHQPHLCLTGDNSICRLCMYVYGGILQPLGKQSSSTHCRETSPAVISGFFIYYAVRYYIKGCLLSFSFFSFLASYLPASGSFPQWEDNPESSRESFDLPLIFPNVYTHTCRTERFSGNFCLQFPMDCL